MKTHVRQMFNPMTYGLLLLLLLPLQVMAQDDTEIAVSDPVTTLIVDAEQARFVPFDADAVSEDATEEMSTADDAMLPTHELVLDGVSNSFQMWMGPGYTLHDEIDVLARTWGDLDLSGLISTFSNLDNFFDLVVLNMMYFEEVDQLVVWVANIKPLDSTMAIEDVEMEDVSLYIPLSTNQMGSFERAFVANIRTGEPNPFQLLLQCAAHETVDACSQDDACIVFNTSLSSSFLCLPATNFGN